MEAESEFTQHYDASRRDPAQVWLFCRSCRCRIQVRCVARPELPFRCFCGQQGTLAEFDVFEVEDEVRRFASTFEEIYQTTKRLMADADLPPPMKTRMYSPESFQKALEESDEVEVEEPAKYRARLSELAQALGRARDPFERHDALVALAEFAFSRRERFPDAKTHCLQACRSDVEVAPHLLREAVRRHQRGEKLVLRFPTYRLLADLYEENGQAEHALQVALRAKAIGLPGHEERIARLRPRGS